MSRSTAAQSGRIRGVAASVPRLEGATLRRAVELLGQLRFDERAHSGRPVDAAQASLLMNSAVDCQNR